MTDKDSKKIKILAIQGSPRPKRSNTEILLQQFIKGAQSQGAETETIYLADKNIHHCLGCYTCWIKTPGVCKLKDDMPELLEKIRTYDILVLATPLYVSNMSSLLKAFCDRTLPLLDYHYVKYKDFHIHPQRFHIRFKIVMVSTCGLPETSQYDGLKAVFRKMEDNMQAQIAGELYMASSELIRDDNYNKPVLEAAYQAGIEIIRDGRVTPKTEALIQKPLMPSDKMAARANKWFSERLEKLQQE